MRFLILIALLWQVNACAMGAKLKYAEFPDLSVEKDIWFFNKENPGKVYRNTDCVKWKANKKTCKDDKLKTQWIDLNSSEWAGAFDEMNMIVIDYDVYRRLVEGL